MSDDIILKNITVKEVKLVKGNYEGYDYYKLIGTTNNGIKLSTKLTAFEYETLKQANR